MNEAATPLHFRSAAVRRLPRWQLMYCFPAAPSSEPLVLRSAELPAAASPLRSLRELATLERSSVQALLQRRKRTPLPVHCMDAGAGAKPSTSRLPKVPLYRLGLKVFSSLQLNYDRYAIRELFDVV